MAKKKTTPKTFSLVHRNGSTSAGPFRVFIREPETRPPAGTSGPIVKGDILQRLEFPPNIPIEVDEEQLRHCLEHIAVGLLHYAEESLFAKDEQPDEQPVAETLDDEDALLGAG